MLLCFLFPHPFPYILFLLLAMTELVDFDTTLGADSATSKVLDDDESVELEKSNVLFMGPTWSGMAYNSSCLRNENQLHPYSGVVISILASEF